MQGQSPGIFVNYCTSTLCISWSPLVNHFQKTYQNHFLKRKICFEFFSTGVTLALQAFSNTVQAAPGEVVENFQNPILKNLEHFQMRVFYLSFIFRQHQWCQESFGPELEETKNPRMHPLAKTTSEQVPLHAVSNFKF